VGQGCEGCGSQAELISSFPPETGAAETDVLPPSVPTSPRNRKADQRFRKKNSQQNGWITTSAPIFALHSLDSAVTTGIGPGHQKNGQSRPPRSKIFGCRSSRCPGTRAASCARRRSGLVQGRRRQVLLWAQSGRRAAEGQQSLPTSSNTFFRRRGGPRFKGRQQD
jgi:hypothetical protein